MQDDFNNTDEIACIRCSQVLAKSEAETQTTEGYGGRTAEIFYEDNGIQVDSLGADFYDFTKVLLESAYNLSKCCGIPSLKVLNWLEKCCKQLLPNDRCICSMKKRILITCRKLRTNLSFKDLAIQFSIKKNIVRQLFSRYSSGTSTSLPLSCLLANK